PDRPRSPLDAPKQHQHYGESDEVTGRQRRQPVVGGGDNGQRQQHYDRFQDQRARHDTAEALPWVRSRLAGDIGLTSRLAGDIGLTSRLAGDTGLGGLRLRLLGHSGSFPNSVRAAPAVTTEPVITTPAPPNPSPSLPDSSTSAVAISIASGSVAAVTTRSGPNRSSARNARASTSSARGDPLWVTTI